MKPKLLLIIFLLILLISIIIKNNKLCSPNEYYTNEDIFINPPSNIPLNEKGKLGGNGFPSENLNGFPNSTKPDISQVLYDPTFQDVITYNNDDNPYEIGQSNGINKCLNFCDGSCVEFGQTGIAFCYPSIHKEPYINPH
jgi:hypothetical protein